MTKYQVTFKGETIRLAVIRNGIVSVKRFETVPSLINHIKENDLDVCVGDVKIVKERNKQ